MTQTSAPIQQAGCRNLAKPMFCVVPSREPFFENPQSLPEGISREQAGGTLFASSHEVANNGPEGLL